MTLRLKTGWANLTQAPPPFIAPVFFEHTYYNIEAY